METFIHYPMVIGTDIIATSSAGLLNPVTGEPFAIVTIGTITDVDRAVATAKTAQVAGAALSYGERSLALLKFADVL
jgi:betaine-aldehyde dehydrogenase